MRDRSIFLARSGTGSSKWFVKRKEIDDVKTSLKEIICIMISPQEGNKAKDGGGGTLLQSDIV